ncbi:hypothetical protein H5410_041476 [Solanum commersonii]|uniref:Uncharacterized protein n=1 Tax=Solanum commersonii TaxID=4109 RepID=A0A9J5XT77_SOLCO|nr:hypothetical protein H5410_041476 [Solanum commersonii]
MCLNKIQAQSIDYGLYACLFTKCISNRVFDMGLRSKNVDGTISESEVTEMVASKFGGPRIEKEHAEDTINYPIPRPRK